MINVLDQGYVHFIESWGVGEAGVAEAGIVEAARQSTQGNFRGWDLDKKLLAFLFNSKPQHSTPFEFAGMVIEVQAPIFVFREWHRHRAQSYNEMSARYSPMPDVNYLPQMSDVLARADKARTEKNRQASAKNVSAAMTTQTADNWLNDLQDLYEHSQRVYQKGLSIGVPKELARLPVPVARYSRMRASANLRNWLAFLTLRMDENAQWEIRQYANAVAEVVKAEFPIVYGLFEGREL